MTVSKFCLTMTALMRASVKIPPGRARFIFLSVAVIGGLANFSASARPIEFSEPTQSNVVSQVSSLGAKQSDLPSLEDRVFKPHSYETATPIYRMVNPPMASPAAINFRKRNSSGPFDNEPDWMQFAPDKMLLKKLERDAAKLPPFGAANKSPDAASWNPFNLPPSSHDSATRNDPRIRTGESNRWESVADALKLNDPLAQFLGRGVLPDSSPEGIERKQQAEHLEEFKRMLNPQMPSLTPVLSVPRNPPVVGNAYVTTVENSSRLPNGMPRPLFEMPKAPVAPAAPLAPGQTVLNPAASVQPAKLKPVAVSAPRRSF